jgi:hypothetical protein
MRQSHEDMTFHRVVQFRATRAQLRSARFRKRRRRLRYPMKGARARLRWFRQATTLAVALTGIMLMLFSPGEANLAEKGLDHPDQNNNSRSRAARRRLRRQSAPSVDICSVLTISCPKLSIRYLVGARERRKWKSTLFARVNAELRDARHAGRIISVYPRRQVQLIGPDGKPGELPGPQNREDE